MSEDDVLIPVMVEPLGYSWRLPSSLPTIDEQRARVPKRP